MLVEFDKISDNSRIWIYACETELTNNQHDYILEKLSNHLRNWEAHKIPLIAGVTILENHFIIVALDDSKNGASGCSIDTLQNKIQEIEKELSISLLNRLNIFCKIEGVIKCIPINKLADNATKETLFYDITIQKKSKLSNWLKTIEEGWCTSLIE